MAEPRQRLARRFESEGRSHAFNAWIRRDGSGLIGLPTTLRVGRSGRGWSDSASSELSFIAVGSDKTLSHAGQLAPRRPDRARHLSLRGLLHRLVRQFAADLHRRPDLRLDGHRPGRGALGGRADRRGRPARPDRETPGIAGAPLPGLPRARLPVLMPVIRRLS